LLGNLYAQVDPTNLGETDQSLRIAIEYVARLNGLIDNLRSGALATLSSGYPDHGFVIDRTEAKELFKRFMAPDEKYLELTDLLHDTIESGLGARRR